MKIGIKQVVYFCRVIFFIILYSSVKSSEVPNGSTQKKRERFGQLILTDTTQEDRVLESERKRYESNRSTN